MADVFVSSKSRSHGVRSCLVETMEGRALFSAVPVFGQYPPPIIAKVYPESPKPDAAPAPVVPPPVQSPLPTPPADPVLPTPIATVADAPEGLRTRSARHGGAMCLSWKSVAASAETTVVEYSTDGDTFATLAMLDADQTKYGAKHLDRDKTYTFRVYTLDAEGIASDSSVVVAKWSCGK